MTDYRERFLIVTFTWKETPKIVELKPIFNTALDWARIAPNTWILWTNNSPVVWYNHLRHHMTKEDSVLIAELNLTEVAENYVGFYPKWVWDWIDKHRSSG